MGSMERLWLVDLSGFRAVAGVDLSVRRLGGGGEAAVHQAGVLKSFEASGVVVGLGVALEGVELVTSKETRTWRKRVWVGLKGLSFDPQNQAFGLRSTPTRARSPERMPLASLSSTLRARAR